MLCRPLDRMATDVRPLGWLPGLSALGVFDALDHPASKVLLPPGGVALAVFGGWVVPPRLLREQLGLGRADTRALVILLRYVAPRDHRRERALDPVAGDVRNNGEPWWDRTTDPLIKSQVLYQLS